MMDFITKDKKVIYYLLSIALLYGLLWAAYIGINNITVMPSPQTIFQTFASLLSKNATYTIIANTFMRLFWCLLISFSLALLLAILTLFSKAIEYLTHPFIVIIRTLPLIATLCIFLMIVGRNIAPYIITCLLIFPVFYEALKKGVIEGMLRYRDIWIMDSNVNILIILKIIIPLSFSFIQASLLQTFGLGIKMLVMAEYFAQTKGSIGKQIYDSVPILDFATVFSWSLVLIIIILIIEIVTKVAIKKNNEYLI